MGYAVSYSGSNMDQILSKALTFEAQNKAWVVIPSEVTTLDIGKILHPGNYVYTGNLSLPNMNQLYGFKSTVAQSATVITGTCMIFSRFINHTIYQFISMHGIYDVSDQMIGIAWINNTPKVFYLSEESNSMMAIVNNESSDKGLHKFDRQIRYFKDADTLKYYDLVSSSYKSFILDMMPKSIYGDIEDIFNYIDTYINNNYGFFTNHMNNTNIHIDSTEQTTFNNKYKSDSVESDINTVKSSVTSYLNTQINSVKSTMNMIQEKISTYATSLLNHKNNSTIHPSQSQIDNWNSKSNKSHTHLLDGNVTIDAADVKDVLSIDQIPDEAKERMTVVNTTDEMLSLTSANIHLGDWVFVNDSEYPLFFVVTDSSKLGTLDGFIKFTPDKPELIWENVLNKPTKIEDLGITDVYSNDETDETISTLETPVTEAKETVDATVNKLDTCSSDRIKSTHNLETSIDNSDYKLNALYNVTVTPENIVSALEQILV